MKSTLSNLFSISNIATFLTAFYLYVSIRGIANLMYPLRNVDITSMSPKQIIQSYWYPLPLTQDKNVVRTTRTDSSSSYQLSMKIYLSSHPEFHSDFVVDEFVDKKKTKTPKIRKEEKEQQLPMELEDEKEKDEAENLLLKKKTKHDSILLWEQPMMDASYSSKTKNMILTTEKEEETSPSMLVASQWLMDAQKKAQVLYRTEMEKINDTPKKGWDILPRIRSMFAQVSSAAATAGQGMESTSLFLSFYHAILHLLWKQEPMVDSSIDSDSYLHERDSPIMLVRLPSTSSSIWKNIRNNSTLHLHVVLIREEVVKGAKGHDHSLSSYSQEMYKIQQAASVFNMLLGKVNLVKHDIPHHTSKPTRILYHDLVYIFQKYILHLHSTHNSQPPWIMSFSKPKEYDSYQRSLQMKEQGMGYPYWKPEVSVQLVADDASYPADYIEASGMQVIQVPTKNKKKMANSGLFESGLAYLPGLYVDEIGLTSDKYIPLNSTITALPLRITFRRNKLPSDSKDPATTDNKNHDSGDGISPARWRLLSHLSQTLEGQKQFGFEQSDIDDVRRLIADTNVTLLAITVLASTLHLLFEFLTFKNDVEFWKGNTDLTGLSVRALFMDFFSQTIILLFLIEKQSSLLMTVPSAIGCLIALWKCQRGAGLKFVKRTPSTEQSVYPFYNKAFSCFGFELQATRLRSTKGSEKSANTGPNGNINDKNAPRDLAALTEEMDSFASRTIGKYFLSPIVLCYTLYTLIYNEHTGWYSWIITSASSAVYAVGFVFMTPQLFLNYKLKSVAHLPWRVLFYRFLNTFIDDLFAFIIRMPTMARISCFRDDIIFIIYLWQRYLYPVDTSRPVEGGGMDAISAAASTAVVNTKIDSDKKDK